MVRILQDRQDWITLEQMVRMFQDGQDRIPGRGHLAWMFARSGVYVTIDVAAAIVPC